MLPLTKANQYGVTKLLPSGTRRPLLRTLKRRLRGSMIGAHIMIIVMLALVIPRPAAAQVLYGSLTGNVADQASAAIVGARVEVLTGSTGVSKTTTTDDRGSYTISELQPGTYTVTITAGSFKTLEQKNVRIDANMVRRLDIQLQASGVSETISVNASSVTIQSDRADINISQPARQVNDLPLAGSAGRNYQSLMGLVPGAVLQGEQNSAAGSPQRSISFNVNGVSRLQNNTRIDGASVVYPWLPTNTVYVPPAEAIQEVNIVTNSFDAEQGLAGGAAINVIIKNGTNEFHGAGWVYDTNSALRTRNYFQTTPQEPEEHSRSVRLRGKRTYHQEQALLLHRPRTHDEAKYFTNQPCFGRACHPAARVGRGYVSNGGTGRSYDLRSGIESQSNPANAICQQHDSVQPHRYRGDRTYEPSATANRARLHQQLCRQRCSARSTAPTLMERSTTLHNDKLTVCGRYSISPTNIVEPPIFGPADGPALNGGQLGTRPVEFSLLEWAALTLSVRR